MSDVGLASQFEPFDRASNRPATVPTSRRACVAMHAFYRPGLRTARLSGRNGRLAAHYRLADWSLNERMPSSLRALGPICLSLFLVACGGASAPTAAQPTPAPQATAKPAGAAV